MSTKRDTLILERRFFPEGGIIINEGEDGDVAYLIQSGTIEIFKTLNGKQMLLAEMEAGDIFGEMTLLFEQKRTASARAKTDCNLIVINRQLLEYKLHKSDPTIRAITKAMVKRLDFSTQTLAEKTAFTNFEEAINALLVKALDEIPDVEEKNFKKEALPIVEQLIAVIHKYIVFKDKV